MATVKVVFTGRDEKLYPDAVAEERSGNGYSGRLLIYRMENGKRGRLIVGYDTDQIYSWEEE